jgi:hypothetical protein
MFVISMSAEKFVEENMISPLPNVASYIYSLPVGFSLLIASNDSLIMNVDNYLQFFREKQNFIYRIVFSG